MPMSHCHLSTSSTLFYHQPHQPPHQDLQGQGMAEGVLPSASKAPQVQALQPPPRWTPEHRAKGSNCI